MKIICLLLIAAAAAFPQAKITLSNPPASVAPGTQIVLDISLSGGSAFPAGVQWFVAAPVSLSFAQAGAVYPAGDSLSCSNSSTLPPGCMVVGTQTGIQDGKLASVTFTTPAAAGTYTLTLQKTLGAGPLAGSYAIAAGPAVSFTVTAPAPPPPTFSACDLNQDGVVDGADVALAIQAAVNQLFVQALDITGDGLVDVVDVQRVIVASRGGACAAGR